MKIFRSNKGSIGTIPTIEGERHSAAAYPYHSSLGPATVLGPRCFMSEDRSVINYEGVNYYSDRSPSAE